MIRRLSFVTAWLAAGHALLFALFWLLLSVPESNVAMLIASALVVALLSFAFAVVEGGALAAWGTETRLRDLPRRALAALPGVWLGAIVFAAVWLLTSQAGGWWQDHRGEIDAWLMAQFGSPETGRLHAAAGWVFAFLSYVVGLSLALALGVAVLRGGARAAASFSWLRDAFAPRRLLTLTGLLVVFLWLPWQGVAWRPMWLLPNWQETLFVAVKLGVLFLAANVGWAMVLGLGARRTN
jgi:hypothetical protein